MDTSTDDPVKYSYVMALFNCLESFTNPLNSYSYCRPLQMHSCAVTETEALVSSDKRPSNMPLEAPAHERFPSFGAQAQHSTSTRSAEKGPGPRKKTTTALLACSFYAEL